MALPLWRAMFAKGNGVCLALAIGAGCQWDWDRYELPTPKGPAADDLTLTFREECEGRAVDPKRWNTTYVGTDRVASFRRFSWSGSWVLESNISIADGLCVLAVGDTPAGDARFSSAVLDSTNKFEQKYGYFEVRARVLKGQGLVTSVSLSTAPQWPPQVNLIDVEGQDTVHAKFGGWFKANGDAETQYAGARVDTVDLAADFHVYGVDWTPTSMVFYLDGVPKASLPTLAPALKNPMRLQVTPHAALMDQPPPDETTAFPARLQVDWIRVYQHNGL